MADQKERVVLSKSTEYELRGGVCIKVYPASLETIALITPKLEALENSSEDATELSKQVDAFVDVVYALIKEDNEGVNKETLKKALTVEACTTIIQKALGSFNSMA